MTLSTEVVDLFVKSAKSKKDTKQETIVYGTTVEKDGHIFVRIDGSELLTPVISTTDNKAGERVIVMIKNHTATITGNISVQAARSDELKPVADLPEVLQEYVAGIYEVLDELSVDYVTDRGTLGIWTYEKWASGKMVCWGTYIETDVDASVNNLDGLYYSNAINVSFPVPFASTPVVTVNGGDKKHMHFVREFGSTESQVSFTVVCANNTQTSIDISVPIYAIGNYSVSTINENEEG